MIELSALNWLQLILFGALVGFGVSIGQFAFSSIMLAIKSMLK